MLFPAVTCVTVRRLGVCWGSRGLTRHLFVLASACLCVATLAYAATPTGDWKIEPAEARCVAVRQYGSAEAPMTLALKAPVESDALQLAILRSAYRRDNAQTFATIKLDGKPFELTALSYPLAGGKRRVTHLINLDEATAAALRSASVMEVDVLDGLERSFALEPAGRIWSDLKACVSRLREIWNVGAEGQGRIAEGARGSLQKFFSADDYPHSMVRAEKTGSVSFALLIDERGKVRDCTVTAPSGFAVFDSRSCGIITERATFEPARDSDGKPMKSAWTQTVKWILR
jgi:hypothetical protein